VRDAQIVEALWESALDATLAGDIRLQALGGLARLVSEGMLLTDHRDKLRASATASDDAGLLSVSSDVLRAARLLVLASDLRPNEEFELIALARSRDVRARELTINAAGLALAAHDVGDIAGQAVIGQAVLTALFDPNEHVIVRGLNVVAAGRLGLSGADDILGRRLVELMHTRRRVTRVASARAALSLEREEREPAAVASVVALAKDDKSWRVREAIRSDQ
jgi:hypothetical protein